MAALPKSAPRSNPSSGDDLGSKSIEKKIGPESVGSVEDEKHTIEERRSKKVATSTCLVAKKKHQEYVDARNVGSDGEELKNLLCSVSERTYR